MTAADEKYRVFISYSMHAPDDTIAEELALCIKEQGHTAFCAGSKDNGVHWGENWPERIDKELDTCDYFLLLLSDRSVTSEMVTEEVRRIKKLRENRNGDRPVILPIRVNLPMTERLNYDLGAYLSKIQQCNWSSPSDTTTIKANLRQLLSHGGTTICDGENLESSAVKTDRVSYLPTPIADPEPPVGTVKIDSEFYIKRDGADERCMNLIEQPMGSVTVVRAPRQMGKSSLLARIVAHARQLNYATATFSFQLADNSRLGDPNTFLRWFCKIVSKRFGVQPAVDAYWDDEDGYIASAMGYFKDYVFEHIDKNIVLVLDEVDRIFEENTVATEFFRLMRICYESSRTEEEWSGFRVVMASSTETYINLSDHESPFNVGTQISLPFFTLAQVSILAERYGLHLANSELEALYELVGGHPYLVRLTFYHLCCGPETFTALIDAATKEAGIFGDHLRHNLWLLSRHDELADGMKKACFSRDTIVDAASIVSWKLCGMGLTELNGNRLIPRCELYRQYFTDRLKYLENRK